MDGAFVQAAFLVLSMAFPGAAHVAWLRTETARQWNWPIDGGLHLRGRRLFGDNKRLSGFLVMPVAAAVSFWAFSILWAGLPTGLSDARWPLTSGQYALLGLACGLAFLLAELPNSFFKRQIGIAPGAAPAAGSLRIVTTAIDRLDSVVGCMIMVAFLVPVSPATWLWVLCLGAAQHALFSFLMFQLGLKRRAL